VDGTPAALGVRRWQSSAPHPTAAATAAETSFSAAQRDESSNLTAQFIPGTGSNDHVPRSTTDPMTSKFLRLFLAVAVILTISALAQTSRAATPSGPAAAPATGTTTGTASTGSKVGTINIQDAIFGSNEGQRDMQALEKKYEPKQAELKSQNDELEALKKQLSTQSSTLNEDAQAQLKTTIETKQKSFDRAVQDFQEEGGQQQQEIAGRILKKLAPVIVKYSQENGFALIVDTSKPWPQSPVLWWNQETVDITKAVVDIYNTQSGVPAPTPNAGAAKPAIPRQSTPSAPKPSAPSSTTPPKNN
jgi:outer membrane protein